jgi:hypothetical protein
MSSPETRGAAVDRVEWTQPNYDSFKSLQQAICGCFGGVII